MQDPQDEVLGGFTIGDGNATGFPFTDAIGAALLDIHSSTPSAKKAKHVTLETWYPCRAKSCNGTPLGSEFALDSLVIQSFVRRPADENFINVLSVELIIRSDRSGDSTSHWNGEANSDFDTRVSVTVPYIMIIVIIIIPTIISILFYIIRIIIPV